MLKKLFSHTLIYGLAPQIPKLASVAILPLITPFLSTEDFGIYGLITTAIAAVAAFGNLGLNVILSNTFFKNPGQYRWAWRQIYGFLTLWNIPYAVLISLAIFLVTPLEFMNNIWWIVLLNVAPVVLFGPTTLIGTTYYQLSQKPFQIAIRSIIFGLLTIGLNLLFIRSFQWGYLGWFAAAGITQVLLQLSYWIPINLTHKITPILNFKWRFIREKLKISLPVVPHFYGGYLLNSSDKLVMKFLGVPIGNIGVYSAASTVSNPFLQLGTAAGQAISPMMMKGYKDNDHQSVRFLVFTLQILFLLGTFSIALWMKEIFTLLIKNDELQAAYPLASILVMSYSYRPMYFGANFSLMYYEKTKVLMKVTLVAGIINVLLNVIFIPIYGIAAAAYTTFICLMYMGYVGYIFKDFKERNKVAYYPLLWLIITLILTGLAYYLGDASLYVKIAASVSLAILSIMAFIKIKKL